MPRRETSGPGSSLNSYASQPTRGAASSCSPFAMTSTAGGAVPGPCGAARREPCPRCAVEPRGASPGDRAPGPPRRDPRRIGARRRTRGGDRRGSTAGLPLLSTALAELWDTRSSGLDPARGVRADGRRARSGGPTRGGVVLSACRPRARGRPRGAPSGSPAVAPTAKPLRAVEFRSPSSISRSDPVSGGRRLPLHGGPAADRARRDGGGRARGPPEAMAAFP